MHKSKTIVLKAFVLLAVLSVTAFSAVPPKYKSADLNRLIQYSRIIGGSDEAEATTSQRQWGQNLSVGAPPPGSPGYRIGSTYYDYQHNGSQGRQVDQSVLSGNHVVQASWMNGTQPTTGLGRTVYWNKMSVAGSPANITLNNGDVIKALPLGSIGSADGQAAVASGNRPGYTTFRNRPNGRGAAFMHDAPETGGGAFWLAGIDASPGSGVFLTNNSPQPAGVPSGSEVIWPKGTLDIVGSDTIIHAVARGSGDGDYDPIYYWRGDLNGTTVTWSTPVYIDSTATISPIVECDPNSDKVAILYTKSINMAYTAGTAQSYDDVILRKSANGGQSWGASIFVAHQDTLVPGQFPYTDVSALYDQDGTLHVLYNTRDYRDDGTGDLTLFNEPARMNHWNDLRNTSRLIASVNVNNTCNLEGNPFSMGGWNLAMSKGELVVKPAGVGGFAPEIFYAVWVQAGPTTTDCATQSDSVTAGGYVNNELWCSASSDDGLTWDRPVNITGTETPACTPGNCHSEHWVSAARLADSGLYLSYVDDSHAGGIVQEEGAWSLSSYMLYAPASRLPVVEPRISVSPVSFLELHVNPSQSNTVPFTIQNLGNAPLTYQVQVTNDDNGQSHVLVQNVTTYIGGIAAAGNPDLLTITFDGFPPLTNPSEHNWRLSVTSNDATNDPGQGGTALDIDLNVFVANPWFTCVRDTLSNGARLMGVSSCMALGNQGNGTGLRSLADQSEYLFEASPVLTFNSSTPAQRLSWVDVFFSGVADRSRDSNRSFRAQSGITMQTAVPNPDGDVALTANIATGTASTTDSVFQVAWEVRTFNNPGYTDGFVAKYTVSKKTDPGFNGIMQFGAAADLDVDSLSGFNDGIVSDPKMYVGARGGYGEDTTPSYTPQNKWAAIFYVPLDGPCDNLAEGGQVLSNLRYVVDEGHFNRDSLRVRMGAITGWNAASLPLDSIQDISVIMKSGEVPYSGAGGTIATFAFGAAVSDLSVADLESKIGKLRSAINSGCIAGCLIVKPGDVNTSGTITSADIIYEVNYVFKGGVEPLPCKANGDVNCSGTVTSADIIYLVNHVFKGQPAPCDICNSSPLAASCT